MSSNETASDGLFVLATLPGDSDGDVEADPFRNLYAASRTTAVVTPSPFFVEGPAPNATLFFLMNETSSDPSISESVSALTLGTSAVSAAPPERSLRIAARWVLSSALRIVYLSRFVAVSTMTASMHSDGSRPTAPFPSQSCMKAEKGTRSTGSVGAMQFATTSPPPSRNAPTRLIRKIFALVRRRRRSTNFTAALTMRRSLSRFLSGDPSFSAAKRPPATRLRRCIGGPTASFFHDGLDTLSATAGRRGANCGAEKEDALPTR
mmetsp:Transcript_37105/g.88804  ORF Transcript_37105/g.88804 Transcript_37105/m.88804 type:complete len:264 (+) Transcript_37105:535-1326(+)